MISIVNSQYPISFVKIDLLTLIIIIQERRDELEGLDLAIERQQKHLKNMKAEEKQLQYERQAAREELSFMKDHNIRRKRYYSINVFDDKTLTVANSVSQ